MLFISSTTSAQLTLDTTATPLQYAQSIVGPGFSIQNVKLNCPSMSSAAIFTNTTSNIGLPNGALFTTGKARIALKTTADNNLKDASYNYIAPGDKDLDMIAKYATYDACVLEFDLIPTCDTLKIEYVFGSEEYPEYVNREFNDIFAFFISGPGIPGGTQNIAVVPGTNKEVSINSINSNTNSSYYIENSTGKTIQYDGFTKPLTAKAVVTPCGLYHLKIAIADVADGTYDSGVFIKGKSISCNSTITTYATRATSFDAVKGCRPGNFTFCRDGDLTNPYTINYTIKGTATNGVDYKTILNTIVIPAGQKCANLKIESIDNNVAGPEKTIELYYQYGICPVSDTVRLSIINTLPFYAGPDVVMCSNDTVPIGIAPALGYTYSWTPSTGLSNPDIPNPTLTYMHSGSSPKKVTYFLSATFGGECVKFDSVIVTVRPGPMAEFSPSGVCIGSPSLFKDLSIPVAGSYIKEYYWNFGNSMFDTTRNPSPSFFTATSFDIALMVTDNYKCTGKITKTIDIWPSPVVDFTFGNVCVGAPVIFTDSSTVPGGSISKSVWKFGDNTTSEDSSSTVNHLYPSLGTYKPLLIITSDKGCVDSVSKTVIITSKPSVDFTFQQPCQFEPTKFINRSIGDSWIWYFGDGDSSQLRNPLHVYKVHGSYDVTLLGINKYGCSESFTSTIFVNPKPTVDFSVDSLKGCAPLCVNFKAQASAQDSLKSWEWSFPSGNRYGDNSRYCFEIPGDFTPTLIATSNKGCRDTIIKKNIITVYPNPKAGFAVDKDIASSINPVIRLTNTDIDASIWLWDFGDGAFESQTLNPSHRYPKAGIYTVRQFVTSQHGCKDMIEYKIEIEDESSIYIPNTITPNNDRHNEGFIPVVEGPLRKADFEMTIFNRWGEKIFLSTSLNDVWDGSLSGTEVKNDVYVYKIVFRQKGSDTEIKSFVGNVNVIK